MELLFHGRVLCVPYTLVLDIVGQILLHDEMAWVVVGILVSVVVAQLLHQLGWSVAQGQGHRQVARLPYELQCAVDA